MPRVFIPAPLRGLTGGEDVVEAQGKNVRQVIEDLESRFPGIRDRLCDAGELKPELCVAVGQSINSLRLLAPVADDQEVHFLPIVGGG